ncbi:complement regulator-acquiring protein [Borreliella bavariensis]|uniref:complement regulator-acquiring protein n=1 Tax=Borreliella bavariensis TaxID=664662 RepID=UPI001BFFF0F6|nr:complement regulator-acquiring protein [Borreliella bavariensis]
MTKTKLNIIKVNIVVIILTLICISCAVDKIDPEQKNQNFENKSQDPESLKKKNEKTKASKLETAAKNLENQKKQEYIKINEIDAQGINFLATFKADENDNLSQYEEMQIKRTIYSSLNYEKQKINTLKVILETLYNKLKHRYTSKEFIYQIAASIQHNIDRALCLIKETIIKDNLHTQNQKESELLMNLESNLKTRQNFAKKLNETIEDYNQNSKNIQTNVDALATYMKENYKTLDSFKPID